MLAVVLPYRQCSCAARAFDDARESFGLAEQRHRESNGCTVSYHRFNTSFVLMATGLDDKGDLEVVEPLTLLLGVCRRPVTGSLISFANRISYAKY